MPTFVSLAAKTGRFLGFPKDQLMQFAGGRFDDGDIRITVREGYLKEFEHDGEKIVAPTRNLGPEYNPFPNKERNYVSA